MSVFIIIIIILQYPLWRKIGNVRKSKCVELTAQEFHSKENNQP